MANIMLNATSLQSTGTKVEVPQFFPTYFLLVHVGDGIGDGHYLHGILQKNVSI